MRLGANSIIIGKPELKLQPMMRMESKGLSSTELPADTKYLFELHLLKGDSGATWYIKTAQ